MPYKDPEKRKEYFRAYDAARIGHNRIITMTLERHERTKERDRIRYRKRASQGYRSTTWLSNLKLKFGITVEQFDAVLLQQEGKCSACGKIFAGFSGSRSDRLAIDHCHVSKVVRGLLCGSCNRTIGHAKESSLRLRACADYLDKFPL